MGMNNKVQIVGLSGLRNTEPSDGPPVQTMTCPCTPVLWSDGKVVDLNALIPPEWVLQFAFGINDQGQIIARAQQNFGPTQSVKLVPIRSTTTSTGFTAQGISGRAKYEQFGGPRRLVREVRRDSTTVLNRGVGSSRSPRRELFQLRFEAARSLRSF